ncbi:dihydrodipicolinate synthase family protein [Marasmitruncus massiliensis]|uniref:dihydrodipicolinate synthase family protein n=1 Tax=Marasmitruncus massiliensis TaxID=1944642 RepID=UPI000C7973A0|nr:dihydrodipicolinate synthase family protein [Marasmitruncus massiliensis]MBE6907377.1 dihydrodipicolinate synthase family protein [Oscillospiraceae bacterium]
MSKNIIGVIPPIITPVDEQERVDEKALRLLIDHCIENGIHGIFVAGSNGECLALTQQERDRAIKIALDQVGGRVPLIAGVMDASTPRVIENIKRFEDMGGEVAVVTPVFYARHATQDETVRHFEEISKATSAKLMIYNIPPFTGQLLKAETVFKIAKIDKVIGYKDTSGNFPDFLKCLRYFKGTDFLLHQGATNLALPSLLLGADGYIPSLAPLFPRPYIELYNAGIRGDIEQAKKWAYIVDETCKIYPMAKSQTASTKYAISKLGFLDKRVIRPTEPITAEEERNIDRKLDELKEYIA